LIIKFSDVRIIIFFLFVCSFSAARSQTILLPATAVFDHQYSPDSQVRLHYRSASPKWFLSSGGSLVSSIAFYRGTPIGMMALPVGIQLNRRISNHLYAYANLSAVPTFLNTFSNLANLLPGKTLFGSPFEPRGLGVYSSASIGIFYTNDARTFSISGSISTSNSNAPFMGLYPVLVPAQNQVIRLAR
jgi:hypothetical protein